MLNFDCNVNSVKIGNAGEVAVDVTKFSPEVLSHVFNYGLKQILNDTRSAEKDADKAMALVEKKLAALYAGTLRASGERETDPVRAEARKIATRDVEKALKGKLGKDWKELVATDKLKELIAGRMAKPEVMEVARNNVEAAKALPAIDDDILAGL